MMVDLNAVLVAEIDAAGPMPFERFVDRALYDPDRGFYATHGQAGGRRGDFVTSVEIGPLFAAVIADWLDAAWRDEGEPSDFRVAEVGAGVGTLFRGINRAKPACLESLTYTLVERSAAMRVAHQSLPTERWRSSGELPKASQHVVVANELLDNLAFGIAERVEGGWAPVHIGLGLSELSLQVQQPDPALDHLTGLAPDAALSDRVPVASEARAWVADACVLARRVLVFDYAATTAELAERGQASWLRTYAAHTRGHDPLDQIGQRDITHDVPTDQLPTPYLQQTQADWLGTNGMGDRVEAARQVWTERAHIGDLQAIAARSAIGEAEALTDPDGLGAFLVLEWHAEPDATRA